MRPQTKERYFIFITVVTSLAVALIILEFCVAKFVQYQRKSVLDYPDTIRRDGLGRMGQLQGLGRGGYLKESQTLYVTDGYGGKVRWTNNAAGFRHDQEVGEIAPPGTLRILSLGDSFNAGYRVGQEDTFSYLMEKWINSQYGKAEVLISCIEDPVTGFYYLEKLGINFHPDIVLLGITLGNDLAQTYVNLDPRGQYLLLAEGGDSHIKPNNVNPRLTFSDLGGHVIPPEYLQPRRPWLERISQALELLIPKHLVRLIYSREEAIASGIRTDPKTPNAFDFVHGLGIFTSPPLPAIEEAYQRLFLLLKAYQNFCDKRKILFAVLIFPQRYQIQPEDWDRAVSKYGLNQSRFDLYGPNKQIQAFCQGNHILCLDPTSGMAARYRENHKSLYLPRGDMHWNKSGHQVFFSCIQPELEQLVKIGLTKIATQDAIKPRSFKTNNRITILADNDRKVDRALWN